MYNAHRKMAAFFIFCLVILPSCSKTTQNSQNETQGKLEYLIKSAESGIPESQFELGKMYLKGVEAEQSNELAFKWMKKAADNAFDEAEVEIGSYYLTGCGVPKDIIRGINILTTKSEQGNARASFLLANVYGNNSTGEFNIDKSKFFLIKSANEGFIEAQAMLGEKYYKGQYFEQDKAKAYDWLLRAASQNNSNAQYYLGLMFKNGEFVNKDLFRAYNYFRKSSDHKKESCYELGLMNEYGTLGVKDVKLAIHWYTIAANADHFESKIRLYSIYKTDAFGFLNEAEALKWLVKAASNNTGCKSLVGLHYLHGTGTTPSEQEAIYWFTSAYNDNDSIAAYYLGLIYFNENSSLRDDRKAIFYLNESIRLGSNKALRLLGISHLEGRGVIKNEQIGYRYILDAAKNNDPASQILLASMYSLGIGTSKNLVEAFAWAAVAAIGKSEAHSEDAADLMHNIQKLMTKSEIQRGTKLAVDYSMKYDK